MMEKKNATVNSTLEVKENSALEGTSTRDLESLIKELKKIINATPKSPVMFTNSAMEYVGTFDNVG